MEISVLDKKITKLAISLKNTKALVLFDIENRTYTVVDCSRKNFCRTYISQTCPPYCEVIVAAKDFVYKRRKPKAKVELIK